MSATVPSTYVSGFCGAGRHQHCRGTYVGVTCTCPHHTEPDPEPPPAPEPRRVQVRRGEVWRTDADGSWRAIAVVDRGDHPTLDAAVLQALTALGVDPQEYQP